MYWFLRFAWDFLEVSYYSILGRFFYFRIGFDRAFSGFPLCYFFRVGCISFISYVTFIAVKFRGVGYLFVVI